MKSERDKINFLPKPNINPDKLDYLEEGIKELYVNLFEIKINKNIKLYQYPFSVFPDIGEGDFRIRNMLFKSCGKKLKEIYGECFISGDSLYGMNPIDKKEIIKCKLILKNNPTDYHLEILKYAKEKIICQKDIKIDPLAKQCIEIIIRDILHSNPKLEFYNGLFVLKNKKKAIYSKNAEIIFYPGFTTSFMETDKGNFLNVTLKNKIIQKNTILDYLEENKYKDKNNHEDIAKKLIGRSFKVSYSKKNYKIYDILFNRNPTNQTFNYEGGTVKLIDYYQNIKKLKIKDENQPLIVVKQKGPQDEDRMLYFIPELCFLAGLEENEVKDKDLMVKIAKYTKLNPNERVKKTNEFLKLLNDEEKFEKTDDKNNNKILSPKEKSEKYGIEVFPVKESFKAYIMKEPTLICGKDQIIQTNERVFPVLEKVNMISWLCLYEKYNYVDADNLYKTLKKASKGFVIKINEPDWIEMKNNSNHKDWTSTVDDYIGKGKSKYSFVIFLIGDNKNEKFYANLKKHSLCNNGYVSQVVKAKSLKKKGVMSVCSKILLQINAKLRGASYKFTDKYPNNIMVIGVDWSHVKKKGRGIAMVATINDSYTDFFNKEEIIKEDDKININRLQLCVRSFIEDAIKVYKDENLKKPQKIIIYRQGVSLQQKEFLKNEINQIDEVCKNDNIKYYYILVNTKTTYKFFEMAENEEFDENEEEYKEEIDEEKEEVEKNPKIQYYNPEPGLLVLDGVTNRNFFEFYIQPQEVTGGSATPTCFHVAYGNLNFANDIPKFTFDLCYIYSNWQGTVRVPNVIKAAEKLSKMTAKYTFAELNKNLNLGQAYL